MKRIAALFVLLVPGTASAALLAEIEWVNPRPVELPVEYQASLVSWGAHADQQQWWAYWTETVNEFGTTQADAATVAQFESLWHFPIGDALLSLLVRDANGWQSNHETGRYGGIGLQWLFENAHDVVPSGFAQGWRGTFFVPLIGSDFEGYRLTALERSVTPTSQTIRVFGNAVPEPATWVLLGAAGMALLLRRTR